MRENITLQIGKCGIQFGHEFWKQIASEHSIGPKGEKISPNFTEKKENINSFFKETSCNIYNPRAILFDLEPREIHNLRNGTYSEFYQKEDMFFRKEGSGNIWSNGYIRTLEINRKFEEKFRKISEKCDNIGSFNIFHSITGGTGSGSTCIVLEIIKEHFPEKIVNCYSLIPNQTEQSDIVVQPYNSVLSLRWLYYYADCVTLFENDSLSKIIQHKNNAININYNNLNSIAAKIVSSLTHPLRFSGYTETNFENFISSLIPLSDLHFLFGAISNYPTLGERRYNDIAFPEGIYNLLRNRTINSSWNSGKLISSMYFLKKNKINTEFPKILKKIYKNLGIEYINWGPSFTQELNTVFGGKFDRFPDADVGLFNHTGINGIFVKMKDQFEILKKRNAFVNNFLKEFSQRDGQEIFEESKEIIEKIISAYNGI